MGPSGYRSWLALRPTCCPRRDICKGSNLIQNSSIIAFILLQLVCNVFSDSTITTQHFNRPWIHKDLQGPVENVIGDDRDGSFYLVINNDIFKYSTDLQLLSSTTDSTSLQVQKETTNVTHYTGSSTNKLLFLLKRHNPELIISCWHISADLSLKCWLNKVNELNASIPLFWSGSGKGYRIEPNDRLVAVASSLDSTDLTLAIGRKLQPNLVTNASSVPYLPTLARYKLTKYLKHLVLEPRSVLPFWIQVDASNFLHDYVFSFNYGQHTLFLLNDIQRPISKEQATLPKVRLARICDVDTELTSYTEISLTCQNKDNLLIRFASLDSYRGELALYVVFDLIDEQGARNQLDKSILCMYSLKLIADFFHKAIQDCNRGHLTSRLLTKLNPESDPSPVCQRNPANEEDWCTSKLNPYIDATSREYNVVEDQHLDLGTIGPVNFIHSTEQGADKKEVLFIGTDDGFLTKMSFNEEIFFTLDLAQAQVIDHRNKPNDRSSLKTTTNYFSYSREITAIDSRGSINKLDMDACYYYNSCQTCLTVRDPLDCVWCDDRCSNKNDCRHSNFSTTSCPPIISKFFPIKGPLTGSTKLTILGENFGTSKRSLKVSLGKSSCRIDAATSTDRTIHCYLESVQHALNTSIKVEVSDETGYIYAKGSTESDEFYSFVNVSVLGLRPSSGSIYEKKHIQIIGENLNVGSNRSVLLGKSSCEIKELSGSTIDCLLTPSDNSTILKPLPLKLFIDGIEQLVEVGNRTNVSLSEAFIFTFEPANVHRETLESQSLMESHNNLSSTLLLIAMVVSLLGAIVFIAYKRDAISVLKSKLKKKHQTTKDLDMKVSFQNPGSSRFTESAMSSSENMMNGLVKLNGSAMSSGYFGKMDQYDQDRPLIGNTLDDEILSVLKQEKILVERNRLTLGHVLGSGQFGRVYKGFLKVDDSRELVVVAVKTLHNKTSWYGSLDNRAFLDEGLMMRDFEHENVLALIGVALDSSGLPMVITPFMLYGDLRSYISDEASSPTVKELIDFGTQVARGMAYLSNLKFVHRDLAARNCMLDENLVVKVADFGLSRDIYERDYYSSDNQKTKLPVKWMAPESLEKSIYTTKTDVWSFGVLLWELMTRGVTPYPDVDNFDIYRYLKEGRRMLRPRYCPVLLYKVMLSCWDEDPTRRPTFDQLVVKVSDVINQLKIAKDGQQKVCRDETYCDLDK